ncbi:MAG: glycosyltransferase [Desulfobacterium sp.]|nr:glycosyltransferase [Desulfobacterium sp.]
MRILYVNWAPVKYGAEVGGGVNIYSQSMAVELARQGHFVYTISSGFVYNYRVAPDIKKSDDFNGVETYEIVNSPVMAPAIFSFRSPETDVSCPGVEQLFKEFLSETRPDVVHFHNIEGFSAECIKIAKEMGAKVIYSLHNYHPICSQVGLLYHGKTICEDFEKGNKCFSCLSPRPRKIELAKRQVSFIFNNNLPAGRLIWPRLRMAAGTAATLVRRGKSLLREKSAEALAPPEGNRLNSAAVNPHGPLYARRRQKMIDALNRCDQVLAVSSFVKSVFVDMGVNPDLIEVNHIGNRISEIGLNTDFVSSGSKKTGDPVKLIFLGVADELKGLPFVLRTLAGMDDRTLSGIKLYLYARHIKLRSDADETLRNDLNYIKEKAAGVLIQDGYLFKDLPEILSGMDLGIVPPIWYDNAPQVVFEMLAMKVPVLGARIGGIPDFVRHRENGILFEPGNRSDLKEKLMDLVSDPVQIEGLKHRIQPMKTISQHVAELELFYGAAQLDTPPGMDLGRLHYVPSGCSIHDLPRKTIDLLLHFGASIKDRLIVYLFPIVKNHGMKLKDYIASKTHQAAYYQWLKRIAPDPEKRTERINAIKSRPFFSIILPTYNSELSLLKKLIHAISSQTYGDFEVCISDDGSTDPSLLSYLQSLADGNPKFKLNLGDKNRGIALNSNQAMDMASGDYVIFCDHDDMIETFALEMFAIYINKFADAELLYSDEDMMDYNGRRHSPRLQSDWNPDMFTSHMYFMHMICCKKSVIDRVGRMNPEFDGAQDYDFFLRITEKAKQIVHIPMILYSWRIVPESLASDPTAKMYAYDSGTRALEEALERRGEDAVVVKGQGAGMGVYRVKRKVADRSVSHVVAGKSKNIITAVKSIFTTSPVPVEIIVVMDESVIGTVKTGLEKFHSVKIVSVPDNTGRAAKYNRGAKHAAHENLIFSTEDVEVLDSDYPFAALEHTQRSEIGAVGVKLIYPNGNYYHTGMTLGVNGVAGYGHRDCCREPGYWRYGIIIRNYSAVSWDFMAVAREKFNSVGGFDETLGFYEDVDFCLKLMQKGYRNIYTPYAAGVLKRKPHTMEELRNRNVEAVIMDRHEGLILNDPYYHPLHTKVLEDFSVDRFAKMRLSAASIGE